MNRKASNNYKFVPPNVNKLLKGTVQPELLITEMLINDFYSILHCNIQEKNTPRSLLLNGVYCARRDGACFVHGALRRCH